MAYSSQDLVKKILGFDDAADSTEYDDEIDDAIRAADALIYSRCAHVGLTISEGAVPELIRQASGHFAAWEVRRRRDPAGVEAFLKEAEAYLAEYIAGAPAITGVTTRGFITGEGS